MLSSQIQPATFKVPPRTQRQGIAMTFPILFEDGPFHRRYIRVEHDIHSALYIHAGRRAAVDGKFDRLPTWVASVGYMDRVRERPRPLSQWTPQLLRLLKDKASELLGVVGNEPFEKWRYEPKSVQLIRNLWSWEIHELYRNINTAPVFTEGRANSMREILV